MIILPNQGLGFISITKCASTSIEAALKTHKGIFIGGKAGLKHMHFRHVETFVLPLLASQAIERPHFFAVVRHPAARILSWFNYRNRATLETKKNSRKSARHLGDMTLEAFVDHAISGEKGPEGRVQTQMHYVTDAEGKVAMDTLIRIEHLDALLPGFLQRFGIRMEAAPTRLNISPTVVTGDMPAELVKKIEASDRFAPDLDLYERGITELPAELPEGKAAERRARKLAKKAAQRAEADDIDQGPDEDDDE